MDQIVFPGTSPNIENFNLFISPERTVVPYEVAASNFSTATELDTQGAWHVLLSKLVWLEQLFTQPFVAQPIVAYGDGDVAFAKSGLIQVDGLVGVTVNVTSGGSGSLIFGAPNIARYGHFAFADGSFESFLTGAAEIFPLQFINFPISKFRIPAGTISANGFFYHLNPGVKATFNAFYRNVNAAVTSIAVAGTATPTIEYGVNLYDGLPTLLQTELS